MMTTHANVIVKGDKMKRLGMLGALALLTVGLAACGKVPAGYEGVKVNLYGDNKGVQAQETGVGWQFVPPGYELYQFPTFTQNVTWTANPSEGSRNDDSFTFQDREGLELNADIGISYYVLPGRASDVFVKYRRGIDEITDVFLRNSVRDALVNKAATMTAEEAYSTRKSELLDYAFETVRTEVEEYGIAIEKLYWVGSIRLPSAVKEAIDGKIEATQLAQQAENEVATARAEADKAIEAARGRAESQRLEADAEAYAVRVQGEELARYPQVLRMREIETWNGQYPSTLVSGGDNTPFLLLEPER